MLGFIDGNIPLLHHGVMLILCCGPNSYSAVARAQELETAFRQKHDPEGASIERVVFGKKACDEIMERSLTVSLFTPMRFLRADSLIGECPKNKIKPLVQSLTKDSEHVIVVSVETEKPDAMNMKILSAVPKLIINDYPLLRGKAFLDWVVQAGRSLGILDSTSLRTLASACDGDAWLASQELMKLSAGGSSEVVREASSDPYAFSETVLKRHSNRYLALSEPDIASRAGYTLPQQAISMLRVRDNDNAGLSPLIISKFQNIKNDYIENTLSNLLLIQHLQRFGFANEEEALSLIP